MGEFIHTYYGKDWEARIQKLLKLRYRLGDYQEVPDKHVGDFGLEGFSRDGCAFQCYAAEEPISTGDLYEKQRNKITLDVGKFIKNSKNIEKLFDGTEINRWILVVPRFDSAQLLTYARNKAEEVRQAGLPYVGEDFHIAVVTDEYFSSEIQTLAKLGGIQLDLPLMKPDSQEMDEWMKNNSPSITKMDGKIKKIKTLSSSDKKTLFRTEMIRHFLVGQNALNRLKLTYPDLYEEAVRLKSEKESFLAVESLLSTGAPNETLKTTIDAFRSALEVKLPGFSGQIAAILAFEATSDWLLRCPLDFPVGAK